MRLLMVGVFGVLVGLVAGAAVGIHAQEATSASLVRPSVPEALQERAWTSDDVLAAIDEASAETGVSAAWLYSTVRCETGFTFDPYSRGRQGELGAAQLHPRGELLRFYSWGYDDPYSPYQAVRFMAQRFAVPGGSRAWSCA